MDIGMRARSWLSMLPMVVHAPKTSRRWRGVALFAGLLVSSACNQLESDEAQEVADVTRKTVQRGVGKAKEQLDRIDVEKIEGAWDRAVESVQGAGAGAGEPPPTSGEDPLAKPAEAIQCDAAKESCTVTQAYAAAARKRGPQLARQVRVSPAKGAVSGVRIDWIDSGSPAQLVGLKTGDVITHVNYTSLGSMQDAMLLYMNIRGAQQFIVHYQRGDEERVLTIDVV